MRKLQSQAVPAVIPAIHLPAARRVLRLTARLWLPAALRRARSDRLPLDERVRLVGEW